MLGLAAQASTSRLGVRLAPLIGPRLQARTAALALARNEEDLEAGLGHGLRAHGHNTEDSGKGNWLSMLDEESEMRRFVLLGSSPGGRGGVLVAWRLSGRQPVEC
jgi:hypothetical protein